MEFKANKLFKIGTIQLIILLLTSCSTTYSKSEGNQALIQVENTETETSNQKIMLALLLDTSNSMDGLIEQTKSQLWTIVNELAAAKCTDGARPELNIALFEYGNSNLPASEGYIRMVANLTSDLDEISEKLFQLSTNGGDEFCGEVIRKSIDQLAWTESNSDLKMIFIAGNEPFTQGSVDFRTSCNLAKEKGIVVNTIYCGPYDEGVSSLWKNGANLTGGTYMSIEQDRKTVYINTPYDDKIDALNEELNKTYIYYGSKGKEKKDLQSTQDNNAASYSQANKVKRAISKSSHVYKNSSWDLVDAAEDDLSIIEEVEEESLPDEMKSMTADQRKTYVVEQTSKRKMVQKEIQSLSTQRKQYIVENQPIENQEGMLDQVLIQSIKEAAATKELVFH